VGLGLPFPDHSSYPRLGCPIEQALPSDHKPDFFNPIGHKKSLNFIVVIETSNRTPIEKLRN
jgi:hypothetical protein